MIKADHATIQLLADKGYLVLFLDTTLPSHHARWEASNLKLIDRALDYWGNTDQGFEFWSKLNGESKQFYYV